MLKTNYLDIYESDKLLSKTLTKSPSTKFKIDLTSNHQIQLIKQKYRNESPIKSIHYFQQIKMIPKQFSKLRRTMNTITQSKIKSPFNQKTSMKDLFRDTKQKDLYGHITFQTKLQSFNPQIYHQSPNIRKDKYEKSQSNTNFLKQLRQIKNHKIDYDKINQTLKNNALMITQLKKLNEENKNRNKKDYKTNYNNKSTYNLKQDVSREYDSPVKQNLKYKSAEKDVYRQLRCSVRDFLIMKTVGEGKFGTVYLAIHKETGGIFALKKVSKKNIRQNFIVDQFILQLKIQSFLEHSKILKMFGFFDDTDSIYLILQFMEEGTLFSYLKKNKTLSQGDVSKKIKDVTQAICALHQKGVAHRDIKPQNIVMSYGMCKLCDFGWATKCDERRKTYCGTFDYSAPQILQGTEYGISVDIWCLGILTYELLVGKAPFYHISRKETINKIINVDKNSINYPEFVSQLAIKFIQNLIVKNPQDRMTSSQILQHPFLYRNQEIGTL